MGAHAPDGVVVADLGRLQLGFDLPSRIDVVNLSIDSDGPAGRPDEEVRLILKHDLKPMDGGPPPRVLIRDGTVDAGVVAALSRTLADVVDSAATRPRSVPADPLQRFRVVLKRE